MVSLVVYCFVLSFFPQDVLDKIWYCTESVSEDLSYLLLISKDTKVIFSIYTAICTEWCTLAVVCAKVYLIMSGFHWLELNSSRRTSVIGFA